MSTFRGKCEALSIAQPATDHLLSTLTIKRMVEEHLGQHLIKRNLREALRHCKATPAVADSWAGEQLMAAIKSIGGLQ